MKNESHTIVVQSYASPCGLLHLGSFGGRLCLCDWCGGTGMARTGDAVQKRLNARCESGVSEVTERAAAQLDEYFSGVRTAFDIPLHLAGTAFQSAVWRELLKIPYGETLSYSELAARAGSPKAVRAAGCANGANPVSIFVPCHRIVGSGRGLVGYGGGLPAKKMLLEIESRALLRG